MKARIGKRHPAKQVDRHVASLLKVYADANLSDIFESKCSLMPDRRVIARIVERLPELLTPGHHGPGPKTMGFEDRLTRRVSWFRSCLVQQMSRAHGFEAGVKRSRREYRERAYEEVNTLFAHLPFVIHTLKKDVLQARQNDPAAKNLHEIIATYPGVLAIAVYRVAHLLKVMDVPLIPRMMTEVAHSMTGIDINPGAVIGSGFFIDHGTGVTIGETTVIGENVTLYQGVTLGALNFPRDENGHLLRGPTAKRHPTLEDNVVVYANASVLGGNTVVGRNSKIGANVRLTESIGPEMLVRVDRPNFRVEPRHKLGTHETSKLYMEVAKEQNGSYEVMDRAGLSRLANEGGNNCGDADEVDWPLC